MTYVLSQVTQRKHWSDWIGFAGLALVLFMLLAFLAAPLLAILLQAAQDDQGQFVGLRNFSSYLQTPSLLQSLWNSIWVSSLVTFIVVPLAFVFAYALTRSCIPGKTIFRAISLIPLLAPSLLSAISLIYWFGNQGVLKDAMQAIGIDQIYGAPGVVIAECFAVFPHVLMILVTALTLADARLYEAADALGTSAQRKFFTITLPGAKYGLISASLVSFTLVMTDFGIPKVIGGNFNMMATDIFKLVIGQQDFSRGSVVALLLLSPAVLSFGVDRPYNLTPSLIHYKLGLIDGDVGQGFINSLKMASGTAVFGTLLVFVTAYLLEKTKGMNLVRAPLHMLAVIPMAVPGLVLGLGYIFFFNMPSNPLHGMYQSMTLLTLCTIVHFYTTGHLTATTALKSLDAEFESVSASLKVPFYKTFWRVTLPICTPAMVDIARYFFINAMTTISAVVFLYSPENKVAAIAILNLDEAGDIGAAAAMAVLIALISACATVFFAWLSWLVDKRTQAWRRR